MKTKLILATVASAGIIGGGLLAAGTVAAHGGGNFANQEERLQFKADLFGVTVDEIKDAKENHTFHELLEESGLSREEFKERMIEKMGERWEAAGLTPEEIQERKDHMKDKAKGRGLGFREHHPINTH